MSWWAWILFWIVFWALALAFLVRRCWQVWPHAKAFGRACSRAAERLESARSAPESATPRRSPTPSTTPATSSDSREIARSDDDLLGPIAWDRPASTWRAERARDKRRRRELRLDRHAEVWARWRRPVD